MTRPRLLVVGATGRVGRALIERIDRERFTVRAHLRRPDAVRRLPSGIEAVVGELDDDAILAAAMQSVDHVAVALRDSPAQIRLENRLVDAAKLAGVDRFIKLSAFAAGLSPPPGYGRVHVNIERHLTESGMAWTILRPYVYMQNFLDVADAIRASGALPLPLGRAPIAFIDAHDVARVAATILNDNRERRSILTLTGPAPLAGRDCARVFAEALDKRMRYINVPQWLAGIMMRRDGVSRWDVAMRAELFKMLRAGGEATTTIRVAQITGQPPTTLREFIARERATFT